MKIRTIMLHLMLILTFLLAACGNPSREEPTEPAIMDKPTEEAMMPDDTPTSAATAKPTEEAMMETPAWFSASLKDVRSGETFTINDFKGKVLLVETIAVWCSTCYQQQVEIKALHELLGMREDFVSVSLDIDPNEDESILAGYTQQNAEFDWRYAVTGPEIAREIGNTHGDQFLNPPSAPILVIDRHGVAHPLPFGLKSAEDLKEVIQPYLDEKM